MNHTRSPRRLVQRNQMPAVGRSQHHDAAHQPYIPAAAFRRRISRAAMGLLTLAGAIMVPLATADTAYAAETVTINPTAPLHDQGFARNIFAEVSGTASCDRTPAQWSQIVRVQLRQGVQFGEFTMGLQGRADSNRFFCDSRPHAWKARVRATVEGRQFWWVRWRPGPAAVEAQISDEIVRQTITLVER
ncbi:hypothetical protein GCM10009544_67310 [Streptomyces stramineus]|uniref:Uncharacterized protein n=1 Tax=Streptomyces stramineus TaxID=173861 RepID=A0ABN1BL09_9ACTN